MYFSCHNCLKILQPWAPVAKTMWLFNSFRCLCFILLFPVITICLSINYSALCRFIIKIIFFILFTIAPCKVIPMIYKHIFIFTKFKNSKSVSVVLYVPEANRKPNRFYIEISFVAWFLFPFRV